MIVGSAGQTSAQRGRLAAAVARFTPAAIFVSVGAAVVAPMTGSGWLLLLDWVPGPHPDLARAAVGLDGNLAHAVPFAAVSVATIGLLGSAASWLLLALAFPVAGLGVGRLVPLGPIARVAAGLLYCVNPFVFDRIYVGHIAFLVGYAVLPWVFASLVAASRHAKGRVTPVLWIALIISCSIHFAWLVVIAVAAITVTHRRWATVRWSLSIGVLTVLTTSYVLIGSFASRPAVTVGAVDLASYRTTGDSRYGLFLNVLGLNGFWRIGPRLPKNDLAGWPIVLLAVLVVVALGARHVWRSRANAGADVLPVVIAGIAGYLLAFGDQGPLGSAYRWAFNHVPGFAVMREPQKFLALLALAYAVLFGWGVQRAIDLASGRKGRRATAAVLLVLPLVFAPTLFLGLGGQVEAVRYPASWYRADQLMGNGDGRILFLPWHQYLSFPFTGRVVANPAPNFFRRNVISGDNVELREAGTTSTSHRSRFLEFVFSNTDHVSRFGSLLTPLGVEYVVVARTVDWRRYETWLSQQADLALVEDLGEILVYRNTRYAGPAFRVEHRLQLEDWGQLLGAANQRDLARVAVTVRDQRGGAIRLPPMSAEDATQSPVQGRSNSVVEFLIPPGAGSTIILTEQFDESWRMDERQPVELAAGTMAFNARATREVARYERWIVVILGFGISVCTVVALATLGLMRTRSERDRVTEE